MELWPTYHVVVHTVVILLTVAKHVHFKEMESKAVHIQVVAVTTDAGPDQVAARNLVQAELAEDIYSWVFGGCCFLHQVHLMVKRQLTRCPSFFSDMAKMSNVWRSAGIAVQIFNARKTCSANRARTKLHYPCRRGH